MQQKHKTPPKHETTPKQFKLPLQYFEQKKSSKYNLNQKQKDPQTSKLKIYRWEPLLRTFENIRRTSATH